MNGRDYVGAECTLDGERATICGRRNDFATVATLPDGPSYEYAWATVARVMADSGAFRSGDDRKSVSVREANANVAALGRRKVYR